VIDASSHSSLRSHMSPVLFLVGIFFLNFLGRVIFSPLMPIIEKDLKIGHDEAGSFFLLVSVGVCVGLLASGFISSRLSHRRTIFLSSVAVGFGLMIVSISHNLWAIWSGLICLGLGAGVYLPSGIATVTQLARPEHWGKAFAMHELAPNLGFVMAPLFAELLLGFFSWRGALLMVGIGSIIAGAIFIFWGRGGTFPGEAPDLRILRSILVEPSFWIMMALFGLAFGATLGVYVMMPLYLVTERGMDRPWANTLIGLSRISTLGFIILSGYVTDRIGPKKTLVGVFLATGVVTMLLGLASGYWVILMVFVQPVLGTSFFPPGWAALSRIGSKKIRNVAVSLTIPVGYILGGGVIPTGIGVMGEIGSFGVGITLYGVLLLLGAFLSSRLHLTKDSVGTM
jgi:NNP family nitrate/nitrite transporter-like MFS transporter